jgi:hypothetical protein
MTARTMVRSLNILIPTFSRPAALAVTLTSLCGQTYPDFDVIISDQSEPENPFAAGEVQAAIRVLTLHGHRVFTHKHLPRRGIAEHRQFLLDQANSFYVLYLDDDLILEPDVVERLMRAIREEQCGFAGSAPIGLSYKDEERPHQQTIEFWDGPVRPEAVTPDSAERQRHHLHSAANILHVQRRLNITPREQRKYHVAWIGACVLYDVAKLQASGGFRFWQDLPPHLRGEDVLVQARLLERYGGCGVIPSGVYHQELPATIPDRSANAVDLLLKAEKERGATIQVEVPAGELIDKIAILEIKSDRIIDPEKQEHVREELRRLTSVRDRLIASSEKLAQLTRELRAVNLALWTIEDEIRECERRKDFGGQFISLARSVYQQNDRRAAIKRSINELINSRLVEEKSYAGYEAA